MRMFAVLALALMLAVACFPAIAQTYDEFVYTPFTPLNGLNGGVGWASPWNTYIGTGTFVITNGGLTFPGLVTNGNAVQNTMGIGGAFAATNRLAVNSYGGNGTNTWFQFLVRPDNLAAQFGGLVINGPGTGSGVQFGLLPSQKALYIQDGFLGTPVTLVYNPLTQGQTYLVQSNLVVDGSGNASMSAYLWRNNAGSPQLVGSILNVGLSGSWSGFMNSIELYSSGQMTYDQFFINDRPNDPIPEAGTMVALGSFLSMGGLFLRRRFAKS